ncbi:MAG: multidrug ABC transporter ATP-binding protein [Alphaproteobacteria bacterium 32-64-14]|nr:MAG: multidrug ABC transporter ATP-binding protein [Alphaproteobacteria bacterium 32-64-14]
MQPVLSIRGLTKSYKGGLQALKNIDLDIQRGEIFALLGPNGAGKSTLINAVCGIVKPTGGTILIEGLDAQKEFRAARSIIGLVPQEMHIDMFETVWAVTNYSRGLFGLPPNHAHVEKVLRDLSLWEKKDTKLMALSGGMKRRVLIAKALSHEPRILFLDEPTAGVDVELRRDMWALVRQMRERGVTVILTTHYIEEAEEMADRVGVISKGELIVVEDKNTLMKKLGKKQVSFELVEPLAALPDTLKEWDLALKDDGRKLEYTFDTTADRTGVASLIRRMSELGLQFKDLDTKSSSLEDIFVSLVHAPQVAETANVKG